MSEASILVSLNGPILEVAFNRPERRNALTHAMYEALAAALDRATADDAVRVVLFHGIGGHFTAGNDLGEFAASPPADTQSPVFRFLRGLVSHEKPLVAAVEGHAVGIGTTMLLHCDLAYAAPSAKFRMPFVDLALVPEGGSSLLLPRMLGMAKAGELLLLGEGFSGLRGCGVRNRFTHRARGRSACVCPREGDGACGQGSGGCAPLEAPASAARSGSH